MRTFYSEIYVKVWRILSIWGYMNFKFHFYWLLLLGVLLMIFATGCEPYRTLIFENQTSRPIQTHVGVVSLEYSGTPNNITWNIGYKDAIVDEGKSKELITSVRTGRTVTFKYAVVAVNSDNEIVYSKIFTWDELHDMDWKIVITKP
jgi:hypothetical protein